ncbi:MAG: indole-3-glycerol phosphate synthase TrpC [Aquificae bacterium]|nr:indole-3-glycerol phosphate synthase TrpC [Aquificota bacterium]
MDFLAEVRKKKEKEINLSPSYLRNLERRVQTYSPLSLEKALTSCGTKIIAEVKKASPSQGKIKEVSPEHQAKLYEKAGAVAISVLTERNYFSGSLEDLAQVRKSVNLPLLRKDFLFHRVHLLEARAFGADAVLLIVGMLSDKELRELISFAEELGLTPLVEVFNLEEAKRALDAGARVIGINNRDLRTLKVDLRVTKELAPRIKEMGARFVISESGISRREEILELMNYQVDAFLVGTSLMKSDDPYLKLRELLGFERA